MRMKPLLISFIVVCISAAGTLAAVLFIPSNKNEPQAPSITREPQITLNQIIGEAITIYATSPYRRYSSEELHEYFTPEMASEILRSYESFSDPNEETPIEFEEQPLPEIGPFQIVFDGGQYTVKLQFGEVFYNYRLAIAPNRIITEISDGGVAFE